MQTEQEIRKAIDEFPRYDITNLGRVFNRNTGREMAHSQVQYGIITVGLIQDVLDDDEGYVVQHSVQKTRSIKSLVAKAFVPGESRTFNTPIQLDGDRNNLRADNIAWRPRWFAIRYTRQMYSQEDWYFTGPIIDITHNVVYETIFEAAVANGLLCKDILSSLRIKKPVFPNGSQFRYYNT